MDELADLHITLDRIEEANELLMPMALHAATENLAFEHVERGKQGGGAVALVVVGHRSGPAFLHRKTGLRAIEGLDLGLPIHAEHDRVSRRIDVEADDVLQLLGEYRRRA